MIVADLKKLIYVHNRKTGGSSITSLLRPYISEKFRGKNTRTEGGGWQGTWHFDGIQHSKFSDALPILDNANIDLDEYFKFIFVRSPYTWILSIWNNFYQSPRCNYENDFKGNFWFYLRQIINKKLDSQYFFKLYPDGSFKNFILFINQAANNDIKLPRIPIGAFDQYSFIENDRNIEFDFIGKFENIQEDMNKIYDIVGVENKSKLPHINSSTNNLDRQNFLQYYDKESIKIINELFSRDFKNFNYQQIEL